MKRNLTFWGVVLFGTCAFSTVAKAEDTTNRLTLSARFGFNVSAKFKGFSLGAPPASRTTPNGDTYNYDNGYVGGGGNIPPDISGNAGGQTWYWGYDSSASQITGNTIVLTHSTGNTLPTSGSLGSDPSLGFELTYNRELGRHGNLRYGLEGALNYMDFSAQDNSSTLVRTTDAYPFAPGTTPPAATPANPYQGSYTGPGFVIGSTPVSSTATTIGRRRFDSDIWGFRLGPYVEAPLGKDVNLSVSGGLAAGLLSSSASYVQSSITDGGPRSDITIGGSDSDLLWGGYVSANVSWQLDESWSVMGGVQYQNLGTYRHSFNGQQVELDLSNSFFIAVGLGYSF